MSSNIWGVSKFKSWVLTGDPNNIIPFLRWNSYYRSPLFSSFRDFKRPSVVHVEESDYGAGAFCRRRWMVMTYQSSTTLATLSPQVRSITLIYWPSYSWCRRCTVLTNHSDLRYLHATQDTSKLPTRWAIPFQSFDFKVEHKLGKLNAINSILVR